MELATCGSLDKILKEDRVQIPYAIKHNWILQCANGLNYLHQLSPKIIHRDLKPQNLLITHKYRTLKICDFGTVKELSSINSTNVGTTRYMAPDVFASRDYSEKCDVYSFGIVYFEVESRKVPFYHLGAITNFELQQMVFKGERPTIEDVGYSKNSERIAKLIELCWHQNPENRPTMQTVLDDLKEFDDIHEIDWNNFELEWQRLESDNSCQQTTSISPMKVINALVFKKFSNLSVLFSDAETDGSSLTSIPNQLSIFRKSSDGGKTTDTVVYVPMIPSKNYTSTVASVSRRWFHNIAEEEGIFVNEMHFKFEERLCCFDNMFNENELKNHVEDQISEMKRILQRIVSFEFLPHHEKIMSIYSLSQDTDRPYLLIKYGNRGSSYTLSHHINFESPNFSENSAKIWLLQCAMGMSYLHENNITHCDLKTNILLLTNNYETLQIGGLDASTKLSEMSGTGYYMAPEVLNGVSKCTKMSDVYSFGVIVWEVFSRKKPFYNLNESDFQILMRISKGEHPNLTDVKCKDQDKICELITKCWNQDPELRPTMNQIVDELLHIINEKLLSPFC